MKIYGKLIHQSLLCLGMILSGPLSAEELKCSQVLDLLDDHNDKVAQFTDEAYQFVDQMAVFLIDRHSEYQGLEGETVRIQPGYFSKLEEAADDVSETNAVLYDLGDYLIDRGEQIRDLVSRCLIPDTAASLQP